MTWFLADNILAQTRYVQADDWDEAEKICEEERYDLVGQHVETVIWWDMPKWMETT